MRNESSTVSIRPGALVGSSSASGRLEGISAPAASVLEARRPCSGRVQALPLATTTTIRGRSTREYNPPAERNVHTTPLRTVISVGTPLKDHSSFLTFRIFKLIDIDVWFLCVLCDNPVFYEAAQVG